jgi:hypothetical protein
MRSGTLALADKVYMWYAGKVVEDSHDEPDVFGVTPVLEVFEVVDEFGLGEIALYGELAKVQRVCETLDELGSMSAISSGGGGRVIDMGRVTNFKL